MTAQPTEMISKTFNFVHLNPMVPQLSDLGSMRVVSVVLHEIDETELGLRCLDSSDPCDVDYYKLSELEIKPSV